MQPCVFINLASAEARRRSLEASFAAAAPAHWRLERYPALGPTDVAHLGGSLSGPEKACFASHRAVLEAHLETDENLLIVEDDVEFSPQGFPVLDQMLASQDWDVLFTDVALCDLSLMVHLARRRDSMLAGGGFAVVNLAGRSFFGSSAYVVRGSAKRRLHAALAEPGQLDQPYDLFLRDLCSQGALKFGACFPFLTTIAAHADQSQIQPQGDDVFDRVMNVYRRLMYMDRDLPECRRDVAGLRDAYCDEASMMVGTIFAALVSPGFPLDR